MAVPGKAVTYRPLFSSLSYLNIFPLEILKIDRAFVADIDQSDDPKALVTAIIAMAETLNLMVVAESEAVMQHASLCGKDALLRSSYTR
ncbi:EAL domain-containing protein [Oceanicoccus sagamiensis]|uniref:EAL domain-containing protein n=1 Tax=Oceanicoccus sagamiensis TaxID=716816 RepID=UPI000A267614|nr:EAL domain-containing protein [Oceanicoccus sagamiensis]